MEPKVEGDLGGEGSLAGSRQNVRSLVVCGSLCHRAGHYVGTASLPTSPLPPPPRSLPRKACGSHTPGASAADSLVALTGFSSPPPCGRTQDFVLPVPKTAPPQTPTPGFSPASLLLLLAPQGSCRWLSFHSTPGATVSSLSPRLGPGQHHRFTSTWVPCLSSAVGVGTCCRSGHGLSSSCGPGQPLCGGPQDGRRSDRFLEILLSCLCLEFPPCGSPLLCSLRHGDPFTRQRPMPPTG